MKPVTDPSLLAQLEPQTPVTDPELLRQLESDDSSSVMETIKNIPGSAVNLAGDIYQAVSNPVDTVTGLGRMVSGAVQKLPATARTALNFTPFLPKDTGIQEDQKIAEAVGGFYKDRYGGLSNIRNTIIKDPVGALADVSTGITLAGSMMRSAGLAKAADLATKVGQATDPLSLAAKTAKTIVKPVYRSVVGQTTGAGARVIDEALKGSPEFQQAMNSFGNKIKRGPVTSEGEIVEKAKDALDDIRQARGDAYRTQLEGLKSVTKQIDIDDIKLLADEQLSRYNVSKTKDGLDFSRSSASGSSANEIKQVYEMVQDWGSKPGDLTPAMLDILKRRLDDFYTEGRTSRAMVTTMKKAVQDKLVKAVPEYSNMTKDYAKSTEVIKEMEKAVGLGSRTAADTAIRKLSMALREDKSFRADLLKTLESSSGENVTGAVAGAVMKPIATRGLGSLAAGGVGIVGLLTMSPTLAALIPLASPRVVGELSVVLGKAGRAIPKTRVPAQILNQVGKPPLVQSEQ